MLGTAHGKHRISLSYHFTVLLCRLEICGEELEQRQKEGANGEGRPRRVLKRPSSSCGGAGRTPQATREKPRATKACGRPSLKAGHFLEPKADSEVQAGG